MSFLKKVDKFLTDRIGGVVVKTMGITAEDIERAQRDALQSASPKQADSRPYNPNRPDFVRPWDDLHDFE